MSNDEKQPQLEEHVLNVSKKSSKKLAKKVDELDKLLNHNENPDEDQSPYFNDPSSTD